MMFELIDDTAPTARANDDQWIRANANARFPFTLQPRHGARGQWNVFDSMGHCIGRLCEQPDRDA